MELACHDIFSRAAFPGDQNRNICGGGFADKKADFLHGLGMPYNLFRIAGIRLGTLVPEKFSFVPQTPLKCRFNHLFQPVQVKGLGDIIAGTGFHG